MATLRELKGRIGSVASSEKITGAMKMISSAKMHKAETGLKRLLPFRTQVESIIGNLLSADAEFTSPLTQERDVKRLGIVVFGSDDGLCGAYNVNIFKQLLAHIADFRKELGSEVEITLIPVGSKIAKAAGKLRDANIKVDTIDNVDSKTTGDGVKFFTDTLTARFLDGTYDRIDYLYMNFQSVSRQRLRLEQLLPVVQSTFADNGVKESCRPYIFEPDPATIFNSVLPMFLLAVMQEVFTENRASEQAARVMAMQSANDNAKKLLEQLQLEFNKLRQQSITTELLDILGGQVR
ncbi:MAG: ATP synthase F1 subunit gamma [Bacteroides sp.]|nr:ATP synthase F1 subunit gamma [Barnesiella sp.]MBD5314794.1 ATP synthase F1 subunit gamma [Bacteroides sp.]MDE7449672.1 ATP synthase F1 subunit gamma [Paramuribaculum sp.]